MKKNNSLDTNFFDKPLSKLSDEELDYVVGGLYTPDLPRFEKMNRRFFEKDKSIRELEKEEKNFNFK